MPRVCGTHTADHRHCLESWGLGTGPQQVALSPEPWPQAAHVITSRWQTWEQGVAMTEQWSSSEGHRLLMESAPGTLHRLDACEIPSVIVSSAKELYFQQTHREGNLIQERERSNIDSWSLTLDTKSSGPVHGFRWSLPLIGPGWSQGKARCRPDTNLTQVSFPLPFLCSHRVPS